LERRDDAPRPNAIAEQGGECECEDAPQRAEAVAPLLSSAVLAILPLDVIAGLLGVFEGEVAGQACEEVVVPEMAEALLQARDLRELRVVDDRLASLLGECRRRRRWSEALVDGDDEAPENAERRAQVERLLKRGPRPFVEVGVAGEEQLAPGLHRLAVVPLSAVFARAPALLRSTTPIRPTALPLRRRRQGRVRSP
jgi:hypothetical protein